MRDKIAFIDQSNYAPPFDFHHVSELTRYWDVDFYCSRSSLNDGYIRKITELPGVRVRAFDLSKTKPFLRVINYILMTTLVVLNYWRYKFIYLQWYLSPLEVILALFIRRKLVFGLHNAVPHGNKSRVYWPFIFLTRLSVVVACYSHNVLREALLRYRVPSDKICLFQHGYIKTLTKDRLDESFKSIPHREGLAFIGSVKNYKGLDRILLPENSEFLRREGFFVHGKFVDYSDRLKSSLDGYQLMYFDKFFDDSIFEGLKQTRTIIVLPYYDISQSGLMYTLAGEAIPFIATDVGDVGDFLRFIDMEQAIFDPTKKQDLSRAYGFVRSNFDIMRARLQDSEPVFSWEISQAARRRLERFR